MLDQVANVSNLSEFQSVLTFCEGVPRLFLGMYSKHDSFEIGKVFGIPARHILNLNTEISTSVNRVTISKDADRTKALLQVIKTYMDSSNK